MNLEKIKIKYLSIPIQARASFWFLICGIIQNGLSVITLPIFTRLLSTEQYGLSGTYFAWNELIVVICTLRLSYGAFDKGMVVYSDRRDRFVSAMLGLTTTISIFMTAFFLLLHAYIERIMGMPFVLCFSLFVIQIFAPALLFWTSRNKFEYQYKKFTIVTIFTAIGCTLINLFSVLYIPYDKGEVKILSYQAVWGMVYLFFYAYIFLKGRVFFDKEIWMYALKFNVPLIMYFLSTIILDKADRIMIGEICGKTDVALYSVSYNLGRMMVLLTSALDSTFTPWIYQKIKVNRLDNSKKITNIIMLVFMCIATMFMLFAPELISIFATEEYKSAVYIIPPVVASYFFVMLYGLVSKVEFYYEKTKAIAIITVIAAIVDIVTNYYFIPIWGYIAAGYTTLLSYMLMAIGHFLLSMRISKKYGIYATVFSWKTLIFISILMLCITVTVNFLYSYLWVRYILLFLFIFIAFLFRKKILHIILALKEKE